MPRVEVRPLRWEDFAEVVRSYYACYDQRERGEAIGITLFATRPSMAEEVDWFAALYKRTLGGDAIALVAEEDGRFAGLCTVSAAAVTESAHVGTLGVLLNAAARGHGVGEALLRATIERCRGRFGLIQLEVFADNDAAKRLYTRLGFVPAGSLPAAIRRGERSIDVDRMYLRLPPP